MFEAILHFLMVKYLYCVDKYQPPRIIRFKQNTSTSWEIYVAANKLQWRGNVFGGGTKYKI